MDSAPLALPPPDAREPPLRGATFGGRLRGWWADPIVQCLAFIAIVSIVFVALPGIDVWFTGLFAAREGGFPTGGLQGFRLLRDSNRSLTWILPAALIALLVVKLVRPDRPSLVPPAKTLFILSTLAIGSGIIANVIFKANWGRPRPGTVDLFGGDLPFMPAWWMSHHCPGNCSFISGEASSSIWLLSLAVLLPLAWRGTAVKWIAGFAVVVSLNRIAFGGHFLSDVLIAWGFTVLVMLIAYRYVLERPLSWFENGRIEAGLTRLGVGIRRRLGFPTPGFVTPPEATPER